jgi:hypothetical protein
MTLLSSVDIVITYLLVNNNTLFYYEYLIISCDITVANGIG